LITHLEPDILECKVKWALGSITTKKASGGDGIPVELFQILKDDAVKVLHSIYQQIWKTQQWRQDWKKPVFIPIPKKGNTQECSNHRTTALITIKETQGERKNKKRERRRRERREGEGRVDKPHLFINFLLKK